jgi:uncharacterized membrane protein YukC
MKSVEETEDIIGTVKPGGKRGIQMIKRQYNILRAFIMNESTQNSELTLTDLLEKARRELVNDIDSDVAWFVLQVKLDLEARGLIELVASTFQKRLVFIRPTVQGLKQLKSERRMRIAS